MITSKLNVTLIKIQVKYFANSSGYKGQNFGLILTINTGYYMAEVCL